MVNKGSVVIEDLPHKELVKYCSHAQLSFKLIIKRHRKKTMIKKGSEKFPRPHLHISNNTNRKAT